MITKGFDYKIGISKQEHDSFVKGHEQVNLLQSSSWAKIKSEWHNERIGIFQDGLQVASLSLLLKPLPLGFSMIYIPRGPVMDYHNTALVNYVVGVLKDYGKKQKSLFIKCDPAIVLKQYAIGQEVDEIPEARLAISNLLKAGAVWTGLTVDIADSIQPRYQANCYTKASIEQTFPKHTRRLMADASSRGVEVGRANITDLQSFADLVSLTEQRKQISLRNQAYFRKIMETYGDDAYLHLAKVNIPKKLEQYQNQLKVVEEELEKTQDHQKKRLCRLSDQQKSLQKYISTRGASSFQNTLKSPNGLY
ncbi:UDP-N-acetylmuramoylpentapeptide-lysine N(6)-alanyltransferase, partial [Streptococcus iniae]|uniref:peptidoglycan bridge formation glycyltransferase FemA/FemB family protein n=1 Tax=Streptococcus iniae TaxID=1346 RepID=UPI000EF6BEBD